MVLICTPTTGGAGGAPARLDAGRPHKRGLSRFRISSAALRVNVMASTSDGLHPANEHRTASVA